jgi:hypothetical protein
MSIAGNEGGDDMTHSATRPRTLRRRQLALVPALAAITIGLGPPASAQATTVCTWGGTPAAPTGMFSIEPGLTHVPLARPSEFYATGVLAGGAGCEGRMTWRGQADAGSTCELAAFEGRITGVRGVATFWGRGNVLVPSVVYDRPGNVVGVESANVLTPGTLPHLGDCTKPGGFQGGWPGTFSSVMTLFNR